MKKTLLVWFIYIFVIVGYAHNDLTPLHALELQAIVQANWDSDSKQFALIDSAHHFVLYSKNEGYRWEKTFKDISNNNSDSPSSLILWSPKGTEMALVYIQKDKPRMKVCVFDTKNGKQLLSSSFMIPSTKYHQDTSFYTQGEWSPARAQISVCYAQNTNDNPPTLYILDIHNGHVIRTIQKVVAYAWIGERIIILQKGNTNFSDMYVLEKDGTKKPFKTKTAYGTIRCISIAASRLFITQIKENKNRIKFCISQSFTSKERHLFLTGKQLFLLGKVLIL